MTWTTYRNRGETLRAVVDAADRRRDGLLPMDVEGVREAFRDERDLLGALQLRWHTRLSGRIERELSTQPMDLPGAVVAAWRATADADPGVRAVLDHHEAEPLDDEMAAMLATSAGKGHVLMAVMAGLSSLPATAATARIGAELEQRARAGWSPARPARTPGSGTGSGAGRLLGRLRAALAA